jgi:salicylate hydroxylase
VLILCADAQGEYLGYSAWHEDMLREGGGQCLDASYDSIRALLLTAARDNGAVVRFDAPVTALDKKLPSVTLADGEVIEGDVIVGADGSRGIMRNAVFKSKEQVKETGLALFRYVIIRDLFDFTS